MDYTVVKEYIDSLSGRGIVLGLDVIKKLLCELGNPQNDFPIIHVAGTNGKGSFGAYLSSVIKASGKNCARFVSPCVGGYENTYLLNGKPIPSDILINAFTKVKSAISRLEAMGMFPTGFIAETALAYTLFSDIQPDYAIIECGMGGEDDATNAIDSPALSVITKITFDHTAFLGDTIAEIAKAKSGIIKSNTPVVSAIQNSDAAKIIKDMCIKENSPLYISKSPETIELGEDFTKFSIDDDEYLTKMLGLYQVQNASLAISAAKVLGIEKSDIKEGIKNAEWGFRFERVGKFILDGAHNPDGAMALANSLKAYTEPCDTAFICACFCDKDYDEIAKITAGYASSVYCVTAPTPRGLDKEILCKAFQNQGATAQTSESIADAIKQADIYKNVVIFGTLSILDEAKQIIEHLKR